MINKVRQLGHVKIVQLQPASLQFASEKSSSGWIYDPAGIVEVDQLKMTPLGIEATTRDGIHVLDVHHISHPDKEYDEDDLICIGFTAHYAAMRSRFGEHMTDGIAGENIIVEFDDEVWMDDLGAKIGIENAETGEMAILHMQCHTDPCFEFSNFAMQTTGQKVPAAQTKEALQFLAKGRRGFLFVLQPDTEAIVRKGDRVYVVE